MSLERLKKLIVSRFPYSHFRTQPWYVEKRKGPNIQKGTAIGFSFTKEDRRLVPGMLKSFYFAEYVVSYYDNKKQAHFNFDEAERHKSIIRKARKSGAQYFWGVGPKRRISKETVQTVLDNMHHVKDGKLMITEYRYPWGKDFKRIRADSVYSWRKTSAFFPIKRTNKYSQKPLHHRWHPTNLEKIHLDCTQYHLGRNSVDVVKKKYDFYKAQSFKTKYWDSLTMEDLIPDKVESVPLTEELIGVGLREKLHKNW